ncbi:MAG: 4'-phosphopantetheinyl transferase superfamily protein [Acidobacteriota bacterium]|nr:4'-phosphopantetheinyl transferase superfamily protein [Acidobacteriota bacterium]
MEREAAMVALIVPAVARCAEMDPAQAPARVHPEEELMIAGAGAGRRREFRAGRACAHLALERLGAGGGPVLRGERGEPLWPDEVRGSITHCERYAACAVATSGEVAALGIDAEPNEALREGLLSRIALPAERGRVEAALSGGLGVRFDRLLFCGKEAAFKAWFACAHRVLGLGDVEISFGAAERAAVRGSGQGGRAEPGGGPAAGGSALVGTLRARIVAPEPFARDGAVPREMEGRWCAAGGILAASVWQPAPGRKAARR